MFEIANQTVGQTGAIIAQLFESLSTVLSMLISLILHLLGILMLLVMNVLHIPILLVEKLAQNLHISECQHCDRTRKKPCIIAKLYTVSAVLVCFIGMAACLLLAIKFIFLV